MDQQAAPSETYAVVELMGHRVIAGRVQECKRFGAEGVLIDVPQVDGNRPWQTFVAGTSLYALTPCSAAEAERHMRRTFQRPPEYLAILPPAAAPAQDESGDQEDMDFLSDVVGALERLLDFPGGYVECLRFRLEFDPQSDTYIVKEGEDAVEGGYLTYTEIFRSANLAEALTHTRPGWADENKEPEEEEDWDDDETEQDY